MFTRDEIALAKYHAASAVEHASAAFWMFNRSESTAEFLCRQTLEDLTKALDALGYRLEKIEAPADFADSEIGSASLNKGEAA